MVLVSRSILMKRGYSAFLRRSLSGNLYPLCDFFCAVSVRLESELWFLFISCHRHDKAFSGMMDTELTEDGGRNETLLR